eukprot:m.780741 g.780741  ORF g.780741 m.780741 type:complete len:139 (+) comp23283_c2_seq4:602-1018(+)
MQPHHVQSHHVFSQSMVASYITASCSDFAFKLIIHLLHSFCSVPRSYPPPTADATSPTLSSTPISPPLSPRESAEQRCEAMRQGRERDLADAWAVRVSKTPFASLHSTGLRYVPIHGRTVSVGDDDDVAATGGDDPAP